MDNTSRMRHFVCSECTAVINEFTSLKLSAWKTGWRAKHFQTFPAVRNCRFLSCPYPPPTPRVHSSPVAANSTQNLSPLFSRLFSLSLFSFFEPISWQCSYLFPSPLIYLLLLSISLLLILVSSLVSHLCHFPPQYCAFHSLSDASLVFPCDILPALSFSASLASSLSLSLSLPLSLSLQPTPVIHTRDGGQNGHRAVWGPQLPQSERPVRPPTMPAWLPSPSVYLHVSCPRSASCGTDIIALDMKVFSFRINLPYADGIWLEKHVAYFEFLRFIHQFAVYCYWNRPGCRSRLSHCHWPAADKSWSWRESCFAFIALQLTGSSS